MCLSLTFPVHRILSACVASQELMTHGPVESSFTVYADFPSYTGGVYVQTSDQELGGHAIKVMGECWRPV